MIPAVFHWRLCWRSREIPTHRPLRQSFFCCILLCPLPAPTSYAQNQAAMSKLPRNIAAASSHSFTPEIVARRVSARDELRRCTWASGKSGLPRRMAMSSSRIRKIAPDTDSAASISAITTVAFGGANRPALTKMIASQEIKTISIATDIDVSVCSNNSQRI